MSGERLEELDDPLRSLGAMSPHRAGGEFVGVVFDRPPLSGADLGELPVGVDPPALGKFLGGGQPFVLGPAADRQDRGHVAATIGGHQHVALHSGHARAGQRHDVAVAA